MPTSLRIGPAAVNVMVTGERLTMQLLDGRTVSVPISWYPRLPPFQRSAVRAPALLGMWADAAQVNDFQPPASPNHPMLEEFSYISTNEPTAHFRHAGKSDLLFADGHVQPLRPAPGTLDTRLPRQNVAQVPPRT